jgi:hypothetical protein
MMTKEEIIVFENERTSRWKIFCIKKNYSKHVMYEWMSLADYQDMNIVSEWTKRPESNQ